MNQYCDILVTPLVSLQDCGFQRFLKQDSSNTKDSLSELTIQNSNISECSERANGEHSERNSEQVGPNMSKNPNSNKIFRKYSLLDWHHYELLEARLIILFQILLNF